MKKVISSLCIAICCMLCQAVACYSADNFFRAWRPDYDDFFAVKAGNNDELIRFDFDDRTPFATKDKIFIINAKTDTTDLILYNADRAKHQQRCSERSPDDFRSFSVQQIDLNHKTFWFVMAKYAHCQRISPEARPSIGLDFEDGWIIAEEDGRFQSLFSEMVSGVAEAYFIKGDNLRQKVALIFIDEYYILSWEYDLSRFVIEKINDCKYPIAVRYNDKEKIWIPGGYKWISKDI